MDFLQSLFVWANLPYAIVFTVAILFALLQMTGVLGLLVGGSDHDADADHDADVDADADHDVDADADHDHDHDADGDDDASLGGKILVDLGAGRVPFSVLWQTFAVTFGITGLALNTLYFGRAGALATSTLALSLPASLLVAYLVTRTASRLLGKVVAPAGEEATSRRNLVGCSGVVISSRVTSEFGEIRAKDRAGHFVHVICRIREGEPVIGAGREVVIVDYDSRDGRIFVAPLDDDDAPPAPALRIAGDTRAETEAEAEAEASEKNNESNVRRAP
ncbi:OB-fold-containig protein [Polyangium sp. y55x31]|uniref:OB-fold-containig protein n=1 Tax=Polyangium sp. y55x31 TaxID=3042688 RepID=UPI00248212C3|nr:OB-fold-containig protein [Polyangium sp. y55x31]MDI1483866.1 DUF1449 family protein [Polyangium sp. y55x31]